MIRAQERTRCFAYVYFIIVLLLFPSQNETLAYIFFYFYLIECFFFVYETYTILFYQSHLKGKYDINIKKEKKTLLR